MGLRCRWWKFGQHAGSWSACMKLEQDAEAAVSSQVGRIVCRMELSSSVRQWQE